MEARGRKKVGVVGYGTMGKWHQDKLGKSGVAEVVAIYDIDPEKYEAPEAAPLKKCANLGELLSLSLDFVIVATPNDTHKGISIKAIETGKHVLCEKPAAMNARELEDVLKAAESKGRVFSVHQNRRWDRDFRIVKKVYDERILGAPFFIESRMQGSNGIPGDWRTKKAFGGGMLMDWGVHLIDQILWMVKSPVVEAYSQVLRIKSEECDDQVKAMMRFENGVNTLVEVNTFSLIPEWRWHFCGEYGSFYIDDIMHCGGSMRKLNPVIRPAAGGAIAESGPTRTFAPRSPDTYTDLPLPGDVETDYLNLYRNFVDACEGGELIVKPAESLRVMRLIDVLFECAEKGVSFKGRL